MTMKDEIKKLEARVAYLEEGLMQVGLRGLALQILVAELAAREEITESDVVEKIRIARQQLQPEDQLRLRALLHEAFDLAAVTKRRLRDQEQSDGK